MKKNNKSVSSFFIYTVFFLSGFSALIYEIYWMRILSLTFGTTVFAATTVITSYMAGLAIGSFYGGLWVDKNQGKVNLLKLYGLLEALIGVYCLCTPLFFILIDFSYSGLYKLGDVNFYLFSFIRFIVTFAVLVVPTIMMGATLPILSKFVIKSKEDIGNRVGLLYGINTFGAVAGIIVTSYVFFITFGVFGTLLFAVFVNFLICASVFYFARNLGSLFENLTGTLKEKLSVKVKNAFWFFKEKKTVVIVLAFAASGFASLVCEVIWFRILSMTIGGSVYAFAIMLSIFLFGLALGSFIYSLISNKMKKNLLAFAIIEALIGISVVALIPLFGNLPMLFMYFFGIIGFDFWDIQTINVLTAFLVMIVPTTLMGMTFPLVVRLLTEDLKVLGENIGTVYFANTMASVFGSFFAGFVFIPFFGVQKTFIIAASIYLFASICLFMVSSYSNFKKTAWSFLSVAVIAITFLMPQWDKLLLSSGVFFNAGFYAEEFYKGDLKEYLNKKEELLFYDEGVDITTTVYKTYEEDDSFELSLAINGKVTAGFFGNKFIHSMLAMLPLTLHPDPKKAVVVGLGSGVTLGAMEQFPLLEIEAIEISEGVVEASKIFEEYNNYAHRDKRAKIIVDDGRAYLKHSGNKYDVIISEPPVPIMAGVANLFTKEFYEIMKSSLNDGGIVCQWIHGYGLRSEDLKILLKTFKEVYPHASLWVFDVNNLILIGTKEELNVSYERLRKVIELDIKSKNIFQSFDFHSVDNFLSGMLMDGPMIEEYTQGVKMNTDNRPLIEFSIPKSMYLSSIEDTYNDLIAFKDIVAIDVSDVFVVNERNRAKALGLDLNFSERIKYLKSSYYVKSSFLTFTGEAGDDRSAPKGINGMHMFKFLPLKQTFEMKKSLETLAKFNFKDYGSGDIYLRVSYKRQDSQLQEYGYIKNVLEQGLSFGVRGVKHTQGSKKTDNVEYLWIHSKGKGLDTLSLAWYCPLSEKGYTANIVTDPLLSKDRSFLIDEMTSFLKCSKN